METENMVTYIYNKTCYSVNVFVYYFMILTLQCLYEYMYNAFVPHTINKKMYIYKRYSMNYCSLFQNKGSNFKIYALLVCRNSHRTNVSKHGKIHIGVSLSSILTQIRAVFCISGHPWTSQLKRM